jgi:hypothetical protein
MTDLAYMVRDDWGQRGTAMLSSSARIQEWLGPEPYLFAMADANKFNDPDHDADLEAARYISPRVMRGDVCSIADLAQLGEGDRAADSPLVVLHPFEQRDCERVRRVLDSGAFARVFIMIWSGHDVIRTWLDANSALNLHTGASRAASDPLLVAGAKLIVDEEYNGLSSGRGKDAVIHLLRAFTRSGYPLDEAMWLRAYFVAGGSFRHAGSISKFIQEMKSGVRHRTQSRYREEIVDILRKQVGADK